MNIYQKMHKIELTNNEAAIRTMIMQDPFLFIDLQPDSIARKCHVSRATLYRFCDKLEMNGLSQLKRCLATDYQSYKMEQNQFDFDFPVRSGVSAQQIIQSLGEDYAKTIVAVSNMIDASELRKCALEMKRADVIDVYASAGNIYFADNFRFQMKEIGQVVNVPHEQYLHSLHASTSDENHFAIVISFGGRGMLVKDVINSLKARHTKFLLISSEEARDINGTPTYHISMPKTEDHSMKISSFSTRFSLLYILDALYTCYFELDYEANMRKKADYYRFMVEHSHKY